MTTRPAPTRTPASPLRRLALAGVGLAFVVGAAAACSSDGEQVADQISKEVATRLEIDKPDTVCPKDAEGKTGATFTCDVDVEGQKVVADVKFTTSKKFTMSFEGDITDFQTKKLEAEVARQVQPTLQQDVTFDCPGTTVTLIAAGKTIDCHGKATDGTTGVAKVGVDENGAATVTDLVQD